MGLQSLVVRVGGIALLILQSASIQAQTAAEDEIPDDLMRAIEQVSLATLGFGEAVRANIDRSAYDQDSLIDKLEFDDAEIAQFVTEEIAYEPYAGLLRGAHGTLLARAGNSIDQSLLLATLLNESGFEAVIQRGTLSTEDAERLVAVLADRPAPPAAWDAAAVADAQANLLDSFQTLDEANAKTGRVPRFTMDNVVEAIERDRDDLLAALGDADVVLGTADAADSVVAEAREYFWVDYRLGPSEPWSSVHPAFGAAKAPTVTVANTYAGDIPPELTHRLRIELVVEQKFGDDINASALMAPMEFPSANVAGRSISLALVPDPFIRKDPYANGASPLEETRFLIPMINGGLAGGASVLALNGATVPPDVITVSATGVFETVGQRFESAAAALQSAGESDDEAEDLVAIESLRLQVTVIHPKSGSRTIERVLYRAPGEARLGADADDAARRMALVAEIARSHSLGFVPGSLAPAYVADESLAELERIAPMIRAWADPALDGCDTLDCLPQPELESSPAGDNIALAAARFDNEMPTEPGSIVYRDSPNVIHVSQPLFPESSPVPRVFDIMSNSRRAFRLADGAPVPAPDLVLLAGVAETHLERVLWDSLRPATTIDRPPRDQSSFGLRAWNKASPPLPGSASIEKEMVAKAMANGSVIITANRPGGDVSQLPGWWEVEPISGRTVGMGRYGGAVLAEFLTKVVIVTGAATVVGSGVGCVLPPKSERSHRLRTSPTAGPTGYPRQQKATWLACTFCRATNMLDMLTAADRRHDDFRYCVGGMGGWEDR